MTVFVDTSAYYSLLDVDGRKTTKPLVTYGVTYLSKAQS